VALLLGITYTELQTRPGVPVLLKKRDLLQLNEIEIYDADWARSFAQALKQRGVSVWFDEFDVQPGEPWRDALEAGLRGRDVLVALLDSESSSRPKVFLNLGRLSAWENELYP